MRVSLRLQLALLGAALTIPHVVATSPGCGIDHSSVAGKASFNGSVISSGGNRTFLIHVPANYNKNKPTGMVLSYHGNGKTAAIQEELSQFSNPFFNENWIAVYPQGVGVSVSQSPTDDRTDIWCTELVAGSHIRHPRGFRSAVHS